MSTVPTASPAPPVIPSPPPPPWRRIAIALLFAVLAAVAVWFSPLREWVDPARVSEWLRSTGSLWWAPLVFLGVYVLFSLTFVPVLPLAAAAALTWGWFWGGIIELVVAIVGALPPYVIARSAASSWIESKMKARFGINYDRVRIRATSTLFLLRLVPVLPFSAVNYLSGLAAIRPLPYLVATTIGMVPSVFLFTYFVDAVASGLLSWRQASLRMAAAGLGLGLLFIASRIVAAKLHQRSLR
ncbi:MAG: TVP38/TMEM64 family protein [Thermoanaerobaculia bacterium]